MELVWFEHYVPFVDGDENVRSTKQFAWFAPGKSSICAILLHQLPIRFSWHPANSGWCVKWSLIQLVCLCMHACVCGRRILALSHAYVRYVLAFWHFLQSIRLCILAVHQFAAFVNSVVCILEWYIVSYINYIN